MWKLLLARQPSRAASSVLLRYRSSHLFGGFVQRRNLCSKTDPTKHNGKHGKPDPNEVGKGSFRQPDKQPSKGKDGREHPSEQLLGSWLGTGAPASEGAGLTVEERLRSSWHTMQELDKRVKLYGYSVLRAGVVGLVGVVVSVYIYYKSFEDNIKGNVATEVGDVAQRALSDAELIKHFERAASTVVHQVITNGETMELAESFITQIAAQISTREALVALVSAAAADPESIAALTRLLKEVLDYTLNDPETMKMVNEFLLRLAATEEAQNAVIAIANALLADAYTKQVLSELAAWIVSTDVVKEQVYVLADSTAMHTLSDADVQMHARGFMESVLGDESVQKKGGDAIWNSLTYSLVPSWFRKEDVQRVIEERKAQTAEQEKKTKADEEKMKKEEMEKEKAKETEKEEQKEKEQSRHAHEAYGTSASMIMKRSADRGSSRGDVGHDSDDDGDMETVGRPAEEVPVSSVSVADVEEDDDMETIGRPEEKRTATEDVGVDPEVDEEEEMEVVGRPSV